MQQSSKQTYTIKDSIEYLGLHVTDQINIIRKIHRIALKISKKAVLILISSFCLPKENKMFTKDIIVFVTKNIVKYLMQ